MRRSAAVWASIAALAALALAWPAPAQCVHPAKGQGAEQQQAAGQQQQAGQASFQKARAACLEGRGYTVK